MSLNSMFPTSLSPQMAQLEMMLKMEKSTPLVVTSSGPTNLPPSVESRIR